MRIICWTLSLMKYGSVETSQRMQRIEVSEREIGEKEKVDKAETTREKIRHRTVGILGISLTFWFSSSHSYMCIWLIT